MENFVEQQISHFDEVADLYFKARNNPRLQYLKEQIWETAFSSIKDWNLNENVKVLDAMCGFGDAYEILEKNLKCEFTYSAFDYSDKMVQYAKTLHPNAFVFKQDVTQFQSDDSFDLVILIGGIHHVYAQAGDVIKRLAASLRKGGVFINFEPTCNNFLIKSIRGKIYAKNEIFDEKTEQAFNLKELLSMFKGCNLKLVDILYPGLLSYVLWYNPDAFPILNKGSLRLVKIITAFEKNLLWRSKLARYMSFATLSVHVKE